MTVQRIHSIENFIGLSSDDKPSDSIVGSRFYAYDIKKFYIVYSKTAGVANWVLEN